MNGNLQVQLNGSPVVQTAAAVVTANQWNHLTWRYDGFTQTHTFFVNGSSVHSQTVDLGAALDTNAMAAVRING